MKQYYYQIFVKNRYIPVRHYCKAESMADAKIDFYLNAGTDISTILRISKKQFSDAQNNKQ